MVATVPIRSSRPILLWADTFTNHFEPAVPQAAVCLLEGAGFEVVVPRARLCCGRPLYDAGLLDRARARLSEVLDTLESAAFRGLPMVVLEPSCAAVFRDELVNMLPGDPRARALAGRTHTLAEFLAAQGKAYRPPARAGAAVLHAHCHQKTVLSTEPHAALLRASGLDLTTPDTGCCGMAGAFGYERESYDVSLQVAETAFLPALRAADEAAPIVADGYSCREQVRQLTGRRAVHLAEILAAAGRAN